MTARTVGMRAELTFRANVGQGRHGWLRLTPAYSVGLVERLVEENGDGPILDPFAGTGTTIIAAKHRGVESEGVDINPFLVWLGETKARVYSKDDVERALDLGRWASARLGEQVASRPPWTPPLADIRKWWPPDVLNALGHLHADLGLMNDTESQPQRLLAVAFCNVMISSANVSFGHQSMSFKEPHGMLFAAADWLRHTFDAALEQVVGDAVGWQEGARHRFTLGDSRHLEQVVSNGPFARVITSPPYPNRMSYIRELRPYMYWLCYLRRARDAGELDWRAIGGTWGCATSNVAKWESQDISAVDRVFDRKLFREISARSPVLGRYVLKYFCDAEQHVRALRRVLAPGARVDYIVGNSKYYDTLVQTQDLYARLFRQNAFHDVGTVVLRKRSSKKELLEYQVRAFAG